jgi:hypothetical protein
VRRRRAVVLALASAVAFAATGGCKKKQDKQKNETKTPATDEKSTSTKKSTTTTTTTDPAPGETLTIRMKAASDANAGRPLYTVVRAVTLKDFVEDGYEEIVALVIEPDETVLASFLVFPGTEQELKIAKPESKTVGVYCLLTRASGTSWKRLFEEPESIEVVVGREQLLTEDTQ